MGELSKNLKFNNGNLISFDILRENREQSVKDLSEGNIGLEELFNVCFDKNIKTINSCGDRLPHISFEINDYTRAYLINLVAILDIFFKDKKIFNIKMGCFKRMNDLLFLDIHVNTSVSLSEKYFKLIAEILSNDVKYIDYEKFNIMENVVWKLSNYAESISINLEYGNLFDSIYNNDFSYDYEYLLTIIGIYKFKSRCLNAILKNANYVFESEYFDRYGIINTDYLSDLLTNDSIINKIKSNVLKLKK